MISLSVENNIIMFAMDCPANNLMTAEFFDEYENKAEKCREISLNSKPDGMIIYSKCRHFSTGADVSSLIQRTSDEVKNYDTENELPPAHIKQKKFFTMLYDFEFPVISAVNGFCIGSGSEIAVNSHIRICEKNARIGQPESTFGILPGLGGIARTIEICGISNAYQMILSGELYSAYEALKLGWADIITDKKESVRTALNLISYIKDNVKKYDRKNTAEYIHCFKGLNL